MVMLPSEATMPPAQALEQTGTSGSCVNLLDNCGRSPLYIAAGSGQRSAAICLLHHGADVTIAVANGDEAGRTALHAGAEAGHVDILHIIIAYGADVNIQDTNGQTCLHLAAKNSHVDAVKLLLCSGCNASLTDKQGLSALAVVLHEPGYPSESYSNIASMLLEPTETTLRDTQGRTALHILSFWHQEGLLRQALRKGYEVNNQDDKFRTPLHHALLNKEFIHVGCVRTLLSHGANPQLPDGIGVTPLQQIIRHVDARQPALLSLIREWTYSHMPEFGQSLLHTAVHTSNRELLEYLLRCGVDPNLQDNSGQAAIHLAATEGKAQMLTILLLNNASSNTLDACRMVPLHYSAMLGEPDCTKLLLKAGANYSAKDRGGLTPLHRAIGWGNKSTVRALVEAGAGLNEFENAGRRPLHLAVDTGSVPVSSLLISEGAVTNVQDVHGTTPLHIAASRGRKDLLRILLQAGADKELTDGHGRTPLHCACQAGKLGIVEILIEQGVNITARDNQGSRPDQVAQDFCHYAIVEVLRRQHRRSMLFYKEADFFNPDLRDGTFTLPRSGSPKKTPAGKSASCDVLCGADAPNTLERHTLGEGRLTGARSMEFWKNRKLPRSGKGACCTVS